MVQSFRLSIIFSTLCNVDGIILPDLFFHFSQWKILQEMAFFRERARLQEVHVVDKEPLFIERRPLEYICFP